jgi:hypothetical protein
MAEEVAILTVRGPAADKEGKVVIPAPSQLCVKDAGMHCGSHVY